MSCTEAKMDMIETDVEPGHDDPPTGHVETLVELSDALASTMGRLIDAIGDEAIAAALAGRRPLDELRYKLAGAEHRATTATEGISAVEAELRRIKARNARERQLPRNVPLAVLHKQLVPGTVSYATAWGWCANGEVKAHQKDRATIGPAQWIVEDVDTFLRKVSMHALRKGIKQFLLPESALVLNGLDVSQP